MKRAHTDPELQLALPRWLTWPSRRPRTAMLLVLALIGLAGAAAPADAEEVEQAAPHSLSINVGGFSHHWDRSKNFNEQNIGIGAEYRWRDDMSVMVGQYRNSVRSTTHYAAVNYQPLSVGPVRIGASIGVMDGYPVKRQGGGFFAAVPMVSYDGERVGVNVGIIPNVPSQHIDGALVVQFKLRVF